MAVTLHKGSPECVDYTPGSAVTAGDVVEFGVMTGVAPSDIAANELGTLYVGGGVFKGIQDGTIDNPGVAVYWDDTAAKFTTTSTSNIRFGFSGPDQGASADGDTIYVIHSNEGA